MLARCVQHLILDGSPSDLVRILNGSYTLWSEEDPSEIRCCYKLVIREPLPLRKLKLNTIVPQISIDYSEIVERSG